jgi:hypothetical protein
MSVQIVASLFDPFQGNVSLLFIKFGYNISENHIFWMHDHSPTSYVADVAKL